ALASPSPVTVNVLDASGAMAIVLGAHATAPRQRRRKARANRREIVLMWIPTHAAEQIFLNVSMGKKCHTESERNVPGPWNRVGLKDASGGLPGHGLCVQ